MPKKKISKPKKKKVVKQKVQKTIKQLSNSITKLLDTANIKYKTLEHKVVFTAHDVSATTKKKLGEIAKVVLVKADKDFVLIVLPAGKYVDFNGIKKALKAKKVSMANEKDITKYLKTKVGLLHPFGSEYNIKTLLDKNLSRAKKMIASAGTYTHSIELSLKDFEKITQPIKGVFSKAKR
ncbi:MAG: YbaK/EbsC family protein [Candidatus Doudnabacteria bacterium]|jgi:Ala-tRNA(Pro) deacylase